MHYQVIRRTDVFEARVVDKLMFADNAIFRKLIDEVRDSGCRTCVLNMKDLTLIDSAGLGMLMIAIEQSRKHGWSLAVSDAHGPVLKLLQLSRLDQLLKIA